MRGLRYVSLAVCLFAGVRVHGQFAPKTNASEFRGQLTGGTDLSYDGYVIEIMNLSDRSTRDRAYVLADGSFLFRSVPDGDYALRVFTLYGAEVATAIASVGPGSTGVPCEIPLRQLKEQKPVSGTISVQQLAHPPSRQVRKLLESGQKLIEDRHYSDAAERFRAAARNDPQCLQAHANLALALSRLGAWDGAIQEYRTAASLDPRSSVLHGNLGAVLAAAKHYDEARNQAAVALRLDPANAQAHFVMAGTLLGMDGPQTPARLEQAVSHLLAAQASLPSARAVLEKVCAQKSVTGCP